MRKSYKLADNAYIETNQNSQNKLNAIKKIAELMQLDSNDIRLLIGDKPHKPTFKINDESTYGVLSTGKLAYELFKEVMQRGLVSNDEIQQLKTKEYTKKLFDRTDYPALADCRDANRGNSNHIRYRKSPLIFNGKEIYITTQFFEDERNEIIQWYKKHINGNT